MLPSGPPRILIATRPVDFRKGMDGLSLLVQEALGANPFTGTVFVFRSKRKDRIKLLYWDGSGVVLYTKRIEDSEFRWPRITDGVMRLTHVQLQALIEGMEWTRVRRSRVRAPQAAG